MKKLFPALAVLLTFNLLHSTASAQNEKRYALEMSFTYKGKTVKAPLTSASYSFNRDVYGGDSLYREKRYIYYALSPATLSRDLLLAIKDKKATYDILVTMTDNFGKEAKRETLLKKAFISSISESYSPYNYESSGAPSLGISAESIVIDGVEIEP